MFGAESTAQQIILLLTCHALQQSLEALSFYSTFALFSSYYYSFHFVFGKY